MSMGNSAWEVQTKWGYFVYVLSSKDAAISDLHFGGHSLSERISNTPTS